MSNDKYKIGANVRKIRKQRDMTITQLSQTIGISVSFLSDMERGRNNPSIERLFEIANGLNVPVYELLGETPNSNISATPRTLEVISLIEGIESWSASDYDELISYLKAKNIARNQNTTND